MSYQFRSSKFPHLIGTANDDGSRKWNDGVTYPNSNHYRDLFTDQFRETPSHPWQLHPLYNLLEGDWRA